MKVTDCTLNLAAFVRRTSRIGRTRLLPAIFAGMLSFQTHSALAALSFGRGTLTTVGCAQFASSPDSVTITAALTGPGTITSALAIPANRIQYDVINCDTGPMFSWTLYYAPAVGPQIIGAATPLGYVTSTGLFVPQGGVAYTTLFNAGFGIYNYNTGAPWIIDYQPDHITFTGVAVPVPGLPMNDGVGYVNPTPYLPSFAIDFNPALGNGLVQATAKIGSLNMSGQVYGPVPGNGCLSIVCTNITVETCNPCTTVPFTAFAVDTCCAAPPTLVYSLPATYCFPLNSTTPVQVIAYDQCGNGATNFFTVTVIPAPGCGPTNCISINASNIVAYTCNPCTPVIYNVKAVDNCCPAGGVTLVYNPPETTCFPQNSATPVTVTAYDQCGNTNTATFTVTVKPGPNCGNTNCIAIYSSNIVVQTCSNCTTVPFNTLVFDTCCSNVTVVYNPPTNTCFPVNTMTPVTIAAFDPCGNSVTNYITVTVNQDPNCPPTNCISIYATNITAYTCTNCTTVPFSAFAVDTCCPLGAPTLVYSLPATYCFPLNSTTPVLVTAYDQCGNTNTATFTVTVKPGPTCGPTNCISITAPNIVAHTCNPCTPVVYNATAVDTCCPGAPPTLVYSIPAGFCFPLNSTTPVQVTAYDQCGNTNTSTFLVTVLPGSGCGGSSPLSISGLTGGASGTNYITIWWPAPNAQLLESSDLIHWSPIPGATNSPYVAPRVSPMNFYRLLYNPPVKP